MFISNPTARLGEEKAAQYLRSLGFKILERNYRKSYGEIDIIAIDSSDKSCPVLSFVEVKTKRSDLYGTPLEEISYWKLKSLIKTAQYYHISHPKLPESLRIDAVSVYLHGNDVKNIELTKNIT